MDWVKNFNFMDISKNLIQKIQSKLKTKKVDIMKYFKMNRNLKACN